MTINSHAGIKVAHPGKQEGSSTEAEGSYKIGICGVSSLCLSAENDKI